MGYLMKRIDVSTESAYEDFCEHEEQLKGNPIRMMSSLTYRIMDSIDYQGVAQSRRDNFRLLDEALKDKNRISLPLVDTAVPMVYPFLAEDAELRNRLISNKVYVAKYWPNVLQWCDKGSIDFKLTCNLLPLPIDQRYGTKEMQRIIELI